MNKKTFYSSEQHLQLFLEKGSEFLFHGSNLNDLFGEATTALKAVVRRPEMHYFIDSGLQYESIDDFARVFGVQSGQLLDEAEEVFGRLVTVCQMAALVHSCKTLLDWDWRVKQPHQFKTEMGKTLNDIKTLSRKLYCLPNHRTTLH
jgi:hypothetical protein